MRDTYVDRGEFPYELIDGPRESRYLTWVRNHSNYMAERGFLDYMRIVAILIRGIFLNFLTVLPWLILGAVILGVLYNPMLNDWRTQIDTRPAAPGAERTVKTVGEKPGGRPDWLFITRPVGVEKSPGALAAGDGAPASSALWRVTGRWVWWAQRCPLSTPPYLLTPWAAVLTLVYFLLFPIIIRLFQVSSHKKSLETGAESSVKMRDWFERTFGGCLVAVLAIALLESLPLLVHYFHYVKEGKGLIATLAGGSSLIAASAAGKLISMLGKAAQKVAMVLVGLLGLVLPLLVVLYVTEYLVYGGSTYPFTKWALLFIPGVLLIAWILAWILGKAKDTLRSTGWLWWLLLWIVLPFAALALLDAAGLLEPSLITALAIAIQLWLFCWLTLNINLTSVHGLYRDRLASAYLVGENTRGDVDIEEDIDLHDICTYEARSTSPYHLVNVAHNLQSSKDIGIRERNSDFFVFSRRFVGSRRTGYCRSDSLERVYPQIDLATAMAISAAAAAPNMGTNTSRLMVALMTLLNVRLGYWIPNPGLLEATLPPEPGETRQKTAERHNQMVEAAARPAGERLRRKDLGYRFDEVFLEELGDIRDRWKNVYAGESGAVPSPERLRRLRGYHAADGPSPEHGLIGIGFSGGGIRSATINLGIAQALHRAGVFDHIDYMSTVSGGGYLGSSISTLMRYRELPYSEIRGTAKEVPTNKAGLVAVQVTCDACHGRGCTACCLDCHGAECPSCTGPGEPTNSRPVRTYEYLDGARLADKVGKGEMVDRGEPLIAHAITRSDLRDRFLWRIRPSALLREMMSRLNETGRWVNLSDGGHIENLATIELLRRRCRFIFIGDGEADGNLHFGSLATLIRYARIDLGIQIEIDPREIRLKDPAVSLVRKGGGAQEAGTGDPGPLESHNHFALGRIWYPKLEGEGFEARPGYLIYLKSSFTGDEEEVIQQYRNNHPAFPHESTADQFFDEGQFEAYRSLGQHIGERVLSLAPGGSDAFEPAPDGSRKAVNIYRRWADEAPDRPVTDFFAEWCRNLEKNHPVPWPVEARAAETT